MLHPVGRLPARVYWRRRLVFVVLPLLGIILILWALLSSGGGRSSTRNTSSTTTKPSTTPAPVTSSALLDSSSIGVTTQTPTPTRPTTAAPTSKSAATRKGFCASTDLTVVAGTAKKSYPVKSKPVLYMQVTNVSAAPCKLDVADKDVEFRVYAGDARFWGSHDCATEPGTNVITMLPQRSVRLSVTWSGLTSKPRCAGTRFAVQAGTYKLYAYLNGDRSPVDTFTITSAARST